MFTRLVVIAALVLAVRLRLQGYCSDVAMGSRLLSHQVLTFTNCLTHCVVVYHMKFWRCEFHTAMEMRKPSIVYLRGIAHNLSF